MTPVPGIFDVVRSLAPGCQSVSGLVLGLETISL